LPPRDSTSQPIPPAARKELTVKQQRDARRAEKVAALKKKQATEKRNRTIAISLGSIAAVAVVGLIIGAVVTNSTPRVEPEDITIQGLQSYPEIAGQTFNHVAEPVEYEQSPAVGGEHAGAWLNCGIYTEPVPTENVVHSLEHGAVWVAYNPDDIAGDDLEALQDAVPDTYSVLSPFPGLQAPIVVSAWSEQVELDGVEDERLQQFVDKFWQGGSAPELGSACTGAIDGAGKIS